MSAHGLIEAGRGADAARIATIATAIVAGTGEKAKARPEEYRQHVNIERARPLFRGSTGVDLAGLHLDAALEQVRSGANHSALALVGSWVRLE